MPLNSSSSSSSSSPPYFLVVPQFEFLCALRGLSFASFAVKGSCSRPRSKDSNRKVREEKNRKVREEIQVDALLFFLIVKSVMICG